MKSKRVFSCLLASTLVVTSLTACSKGSNTTANPDKSNEPVQTEKLKSIKIFSELGSWAAQTIKNYNENLVFQEMEKKTGVSVTWVHPPTGQTTEQFNLMISSNDLPDVILYNWIDVPGGAGKFVKDNVIVDLTPYMEKGAPNFTKLMKTNPEARKQVVNDEGKYYYLPMLRLVDSLRVTGGPQIRTDWLAKLGMKKPETSDDWYKVLKAFKEQDANGNGKKDEYPLTGQKFRGGNGIGNLVSAWGVSWDFYAKDGKVKYGPVQPEFKEGLTFIARLFTEGLIDPDYMLNNRTKQDEKVTNNVSGALFAVQPSNFMRTMAESGRQPEFKMEGMPWPKSPDGSAYALDSSYIRAVASPCAAITSKAKDPAQILQWLDYAYGDEGNTLFNLGILGDTYTMKEGKAVYAQKVTDNSQGGYGKFNMALNGWAMSQDVSYHQQLMGQYGYPAAAFWKPAKTSILLPPVTFTEDETRKVSKLKTDIDTYVDEMLDKFTTGKEPIQNFDKFVQRVKEIGIDDLTKIYQAAYDRYQKR
jgi:putative aldouronate transport system substrate-binding protein